jgi:transcriptional regulator with XRE-family HTH domain
VSREVSPDVSREVSPAVSPRADDSPVSAFTRDLRALRLAAGQVPYAELAKQTGFGRSTLHDVFSGRRLPSLDLLLAVVPVLGGDTDEWRERWIATRSDPLPPSAVAVAVASASPDPVTDPAGPGENAGHRVSRRRPLLAGLVVLGVLLAGGAAVFAATADHPGTPDCRSVDQYRLTKDGDLLTRGGDAKIGAVHRGDLVGLVARSDSAHPHRFVVVVVGTGQVGTADSAKLDRAGSVCLRVPPSP